MQSTLTNKTLTQLNKNGKTKFITFNLEGATLRREWGIENGKKQKTDNTYCAVNKGKSNEKTPNEAAKDAFDRVIAQKVKEGYRSEDSLPVETEMDFITIPTELCCSKPISKPNIKKIDNALKTGNARIEVKYNGLCHYILCQPNGKIRLYTRRMDDHTEKYPDIINAMERDSIFKPKSIAIGELIVSPTLNLGHMDGFKKVCEISRVDTLKGKLKKDLSESYKRQKEYPVSMVIFGILYHKGVNISETTTVGDIYDKFMNHIPMLDSNLKYFKPSIMINNSIKDSLNTLQNTDNAYLLEGAVAWINNEKLSVTFNGKPLRRAAYKIKREKEEDVIVYDFEYGKGKYEGMIGALLIGKHDNKKNIVPLGKVGSGLTAKDRCLELWKDLPMVIEITYNEIFPTRKYQFPRFSKIHEDKTIEEVGILYN